MPSLLSFMGISFPFLGSTNVLLFLLKVCSFYSISSTLPLVPSTTAQEGASGKLLAVSLQERPTGQRGPAHMAEISITAPPLCVSEVLLWSVLDCGVSSLSILILFRYYDAVGRRVSFPGTDNWYTVFHTRAWYSALHILWQGSGKKPYFKFLVI